MGGQKKNGEKVGGRKKRPLFQKPKKWGIKKKQKIGAKWGDKKPTQFQKMGTQKKKMGERWAT